MSDGKLLYGQRRNHQYGFVIPYTKQEQDKTHADSQIGDADKDITPTDANASDVETIDLDALGAILDSYVRSYASTDDIILPKTLLDVQVVWETSGGNGDSNETGDAHGVGADYFLQMDLRNQAQGSATVLADIIPIIDAEPHAYDLPIIEYFFFIPANATKADVLTKLSALAGVAVTSWPKFRPKEHTFIIRGQKIAAQVHASAQSNLHSSASSLSWASGSGSGLSQDYGSTIRGQVIPPCIHGDIALANTSNSLTVNVVAEAQTTTLFLGSDLGAHGGPRNETKTVNGSITPTTLAATPGATSIPTSGVCLKKLNIEPAFEGYSIVRAKTFDFAELP